MQQFTVPQFIDVEDKIIGPITARQFIIMLAGFMFIAISYKIFNFIMFLVVGVIIFGIFGTLAFLKINGMPFHFFVLNFVQTAKRPSLRVWDKLFGKESVIEEIEKNPTEAMPVAPPKPLTTSRLAELSLIVDTRGSYKGGDKNINLSKK